MDTPLDLVVATHREDVKWLSGFGPLGPRLFVYTTSEEGPRNVPDGIHVTRLPNAAREASQFLTHIITHYDNLARHVAFAQGNPTFHCRDFFSLLGREHTDTFMPLGPGTVFHPGGNLELHDRWTAEAQWDLFGTVFSLPWTYGAQFVVSREAIRSQPLSWYKRIFQWTVDNPDRSPWVIERLWRAIVTGIPTRSVFGAPAPVHVYATLSASHRPLYDRFFKPSCESVGITPITVELEEHADDDGAFEGKGWIAAQQRKYEWIAYTMEQHQNEVVVWSDVDIIVFRDFRKDLCQRLDCVDVLFQSEGLLGGDVNCGFFAARATLEVAELFRRVGSHRFGPGRNDQDVMQEILRAGKSGIRWGVLPPVYGAKSHGWPHPLPRRLFTFHATCTGGANSVERKNEMLAEVCSWVN